MHTYHMSALKSIEYNRWEILEWTIPCGKTETSTAVFILLLSHIDIHQEPVFAEHAVLLFPSRLIILQQSLNFICTFSNIIISDRDDLWVLSVISKLKKNMDWYILETDCKQ